MTRRGIQVFMVVVVLVMMPLVACVAHWRAVVVQGGIVAMEIRPMGLGMDVSLGGELG